LWIPLIYGILAFQSSLIPFNTYVVSVFSFLFMCTSVILYGVFAVALTELMPTQIRFTGVNLYYNIGAGIFGGAITTVASFIVSDVQFLYHALIFPMTVLSLALLCVLFCYDETNGISLADIPYETLKEDTDVGITQSTRCETMNAGDVLVDKNSQSSALSLNISNYVTTHDYADYVARHVSGEFGSTDGLDDDVESQLSQEVHPLLGAFENHHFLDKINKNIAEYKIEQTTKIAEKFSSKILNLVNTSFVFLPHHTKLGHGNNNFFIYFLIILYQPFAYSFLQAIFLLQNRVYRYILVKYDGDRTLGDTYY
jgi:hypothetical protein